MTKLVRLERGNRVSDGTRVHGTVLAVDNTCSAQYAKIIFDDHFDIRAHGWVPGETHWVNRFELRKLPDRKEGGVMYAHSIKNPHIIHFQRNYHVGEYRLKGRHHRYLCCGSYTPSKATTDASKVTCKNCLKELAEQEARP
jgi:hypothetical protein